MIDSAVTDLPLPDSPTSPASPRRGSRSSHRRPPPPGLAPCRTRSSGARRSAACHQPCHISPSRSQRSRLLELAEDVPHRVGDLADRRVGVDGGDDGGDEIAAVPRRQRHRGERGAPGARRCGSPAPRGARSICWRSISGSMVSVSIAAPSFGGRERVDADDGGRARVDGELRPVRRLLDLALNQTGFDRRERPAGALRSGRGSLRLRVRCRWSALRSRTTPADRVDRVRDAAFGGDDLLRPQGDPRRLLRRQRERFVAAVAVQRLRAAEHGRQRLQRDADDVVVRLLGGERAAGGLRVEAQLLRPRIASRESGRA